MNRRNPLIALVAATLLTGGLVACSPAEQENAEVETEQAGDALAEEAAQVGDAIQAGAKEAAQEVDEATDRLQQEAHEQEAETERDAQGN